MSDEAVMVVRLNADGKAVQVEDRNGNALAPVDITKNPIQGTVKSMTSMVLMTTSASPDCTWYYNEGVWWRYCT
jgi:hypothetical protein